MDSTNIAIFHKSVNKIQQLSSDREIQDMIRIREEADLLERSRLYNARQEGKTEGKAEGKSELIEAMFANGKTVPEIADFIGIPVEQVENMKTTYKRL